MRDVRRQSIYTVIMLPWPALRDKDSIVKGLLDRLYGFPQIPADVRHLHLVAVGAVAVLLSASMSYGEISSPAYAFCGEVCMAIVCIRCRGPAKLSVPIPQNSTPGVTLSGHAAAPRALPGGSLHCPSAAIGLLSTVHMVRADSLRKEAYIQVW
jgi:hypothetical protein